MGRRNSSLLVELMSLPAWVGVVLAAAVYATVKWCVPAVAGNGQILGPMANGLANVAWLLAAVFLAPVPFSLIGARRRRRLLDSQASLDSIRALTWQQFEQLVGEYFRREGYRVECGERGSDGGIDLRLHDNGGKRLVVQCKRWKARTVGVQPVRELYGAMAGDEAHAAIFVTSGRYTFDAIDFARDKPIKLIDGSELLRVIRSRQIRAAPDRATP